MLNALVTKDWRPAR